MLNVRQQIGSIGGYLDRSGQVGSIDRRPDGVEAGERLGRRVAVVVVGTDADDRDPWLQRLDQRHRRRRAAAVVRDLQHVQLRPDPSRETRGEQERVYLILGIAVEQHVACAEVELEHVVPWTGGTRNHLLQVQVSRYVSGTLYQGLVPKLTLDDWASSIRAILKGAHLACSTYEHVSGLTSRETLHPVDVAQPFLRDLAAAGVSPAVLRSFEDCLRSAPPMELPWVPSLRPLIQ